MSGLSPWHAVLSAAQPHIAAGHLPWFGSAVRLYFATAALFALVVNLIAIGRVRVWNPSREARPRTEDADEFRTALAPSPSKGEGWGEGAASATTASVHAAPGKARRVWDNPILWRELRTWAYGRKVLVVRLVYLALCALAAVGIYAALSGESAAHGNLPIVVAPFFVLSLVLLNALAVTSITTERDLGALDLLLVTDLTPSEFIFGKLWGVFYVAKEMLLLPLAVCCYLWWEDAITFENLLYIIGGLAVMDIFVATLGIHAGLAYTNSRTAVAVSLGTVFFLFVGVAACMRIMISFSGSFQLQLAPFLAFMFGGSTGLFVALACAIHRKPSAWRRCFCRCSLSWPSPVSCREKLWESSWSWPSPTA